MGVAGVMTSRRHSWFEPSGPTGQCFPGIFTEHLLGSRMTRCHDAQPSDNSDRTSDPMEQMTMTPRIEGMLKGSKNLRLDPLRFTKCFPHTNPNCHSLRAAKLPKVVDRRVFQVFNMYLRHSCGLIAAPLRMRSLRMIPLFNGRKSTGNPKTSMISCGCSLWSIHWFKASCMSSLPACFSPKDLCATSYGTWPASMPIDRSY